MDPLAEKYPSLSAYAYVANNPIKFIDPDGRDVILSKLFSQGDFGKAFKNLRANNKSFQRTIGKFENNSNYNLRLSVNNAKVLAAGAGAVTEYEKSSYTEVPKSLNVNGYFMSTASINGYPEYEYSEIGIVTVIAHEAIHQKMALLPVNEDDSHNAFNNYKTDLVNILTEYNTSNNLKLSKDDITVLSFSGQQESKAFKSYINNRAKKSNISYEKAKDNYDRQLSNLIYQRKSDHEK